MFVGLSIRDVVLVERLELGFERGLGVLTGETGAGKSILLDALGLALGARGDASLVRDGAGPAIVTAAFDIGADHPAHELLADRGVEGDEHLVLRRSLTADGRSRAFVNDQPVSVGLLREIGDLLVEIQGQFAARGLLDTNTHTEALDTFGHLTSLRGEVGRSYSVWRSSVQEAAAAEAALARARADEEFLRHAAGEIDALEPRLGEEAELAERRGLLKHREQLAEALSTAYEGLSGARNVEDSLRAAQAALARVADKAGGGLNSVIEALDRATDAAAEALAELEAVGREIQSDATTLESLEERLFALRDVARKHRCGVDQLPVLREEIGRKLAMVDRSDEELARRAAEMSAARSGYEKLAERLSRNRAAAATRLDEAIAAELPPLKLEKATLRTRIERRAEPDWGPGGVDRIAFEVSTNPGAPFGPLARIASGGELARFMLALKVTMVDDDARLTLVFDEVDSGISGAVAAAVGERLAQLGRNQQVLVVTHSPQVAARGEYHRRVAKIELASGTVTTVDALDTDARREEIARMISGATITDEARAAADRLIGDKYAAESGL